MMAVTRYWDTVITTAVKTTTTLLLFIIIIIIYSNKVKGTIHVQQLYTVTLNKYLTNKIE